MCYTANDSLLGYIINTISSLLLFTIADDAQFKVMSLFLLFVGQMQLFDFAFWKNQSCTVTNTIITKIATIFNHLQPIILYLLQGIYGFKQSDLSLTIFLLYIVIGIPYNINAFSSVKCTLPANGVMKWDWNHLRGAELYYALFIGYLFFASFNFNNVYFGILSALATILTFFIAHKTPLLNISVGRIWCYYAALMPLIFIALYYLR